jgi:exopolysaccharide production protein ExoQ
MIEAMVVAAGFVAYLSSSPGLDAIARPLIFVLLLFAALVAIMGKKVRPITPTASELLLYAVGLLSSAVALVRSVDYSIFYSMYFLTAIVCVSVIVRAVPLERLLDLAAMSILLCVVTTVVFDWRDLLTCLSISIGKSGLHRFTPFGSHPLLVGYIFGSGSILLARRAYLARRAWERYAMTGGVVLAWAMVLGASARSAVAGLVVAAVFAYIAEFRFFKDSSLGRAGMIAIVIGAVAAVYFAATSTYLQSLLEVNSETRGLGSGVTGRTDLWAKGLMSLTSDPTLVAFGGGLRSSEYSVIGFLTENSYITILLDSGALLGSALILFLMLAPFSALRQSRASTAAPNVLVLLPSFFVFLLVQCFFVRYLVGLGNPTALYTLVLFTALSMRPGFQQSLGKDSQVRGAPVPADPRAVVMRKPARQ